MNGKPMTLRSQIEDILQRRDGTIPEVTEQIIKAGRAPEGLAAAIADIEREHNDAGSLAHTVEHHWPTVKAAIEQQAARCKALEAERDAMKKALAKTGVMLDAGYSRETVKEHLLAALAATKGKP